MKSRNSVVSKIFWKRIIKNPQKIKLHFCFRTQYLPIDIIMKNKRSMELITSPFSCSQICPILILKYKEVLELFKESGLRKPLIYLRKPFHDAIIIPCYIPLIISKKWTRMTKISKKMNVLITIRGFRWKKKRAFSIILRAFLRKNIKNSRHKHWP